MQTQPPTLPPENLNGEDASPAAEGSGPLSAPPQVIGGMPAQPDSYTYRRHRMRWVYWLVAIVVAAVVVVVVLVINAYVLQLAKVSGSSMQPTLYNNHIIVVWKWPQTWAWLTDEQYIPARGDIISLHDTDNSGEQLVKRVIGLPGDTVSIKRGTVTIYDDQHPDGFDPDSAPYGKDLAPTVGTFTTTVGVGQVFVMGDNRAAGASIDSRSGLGDIPSSYIIGQVVLRVYPLDKITLF